MPTPVIDDRKYSKRPAISYGIMDEIHAPALRRSRWCWSRPSMKGNVLPAADPHAQVYALQSIEAPYSLPIHQPALAPQ